MVRRHQLVLVATLSTLLAAATTLAGHGITDYLRLEPLLEGPNCPVVPEAVPYDDNADGDLDLADLAAFQADFVGPTIDRTVNGPCEMPWRDPNDPFDCGEDAVVIEVDGHTVHVVHANALYNCCPLCFEHAVCVSKDALTVTEFEILELPCPCLCCYEIETSIADVPSGQYMLAFWWHDSWDGGWRCDQQSVIVP